jgi:glyoxylase-like metal-dependent hydrolase (beta-lactamase superfamily II)
MIYGAISRRDTLKLAACATTALVVAVDTSVFGAAPGAGDHAKGVGREVGADPHAAPNPDERHALVPVRDNLYRFEIGQGRSQHSALLLVTDDGILLTDPIQTNGAMWLRDELKKRFNKPVKYVVYSHAHFDHIGGGQVFQRDGATVVAHENAVEPIIGEKLPTAVPDKTFKKDLTLELGGEKVELTRVSPSHSNSMIMIHFPKQRAMMAVDFCPVGALPYNDFLDFYYDGWMESLHWLDSQDFDTLEGGHYDLGTKKEVGINIEYMQSLHDQVLKLIRAGQSWDQLWRNVKLDKFKDRIGYGDMRVLNIEAMFRWVSNHRRGIW